MVEVLVQLQVTNKDIHLNCQGILLAINQQRKLSKLKLKKEIIINIEKLRLRDRDKAHNLE